MSTTGAAPIPTRLLAEGGPLANLDQVATATASTVVGGPAHGCRAVDLRVAGGVDLRVLPDRGLDLGAAWFAGVPLAWISAVGEAAPLDVLRDADWVTRFGGGLVTTCGLRNVGTPSEGHGQHGDIDHRRARDVEVARTRDGEAVVLRVAGVVEEAGALGPHLRLTRAITTRSGEGRVTITDVTANLGAQPEPAPLLYHVNLGAPLWAPGARLTVDGGAGAPGEVVPRDDDARAGLAAWDVAPDPDPAAPEQVFEHLLGGGGGGEAAATVTNEALGIELTLRWDRATLPRLHQWRHPGQAVLGLEPANCSVRGRAHDRAEGRLPVLAPGEHRTTRLELLVRHR